MKKTTVIHWFRQDLRLIDNPALSAAAQQEQVLPVYILDDENSGKYSMGAASRWWLHHSLCKLNEDLQNNLQLYYGNPETILLELIKNHTVDAVYWNRCYEPWRIQRDYKIQQLLTKQGIKVKIFNGSLLWEPGDITKKDGTLYRVFTPFFRNACMHSKSPRQPLPKPGKLNLVAAIKEVRDIDSLRLLPNVPWHAKLNFHWKIGEKAAQKKLCAFVNSSLEHYETGRDFPAMNCVSRLSPHLHFGEISPNQAWYAAKSIAYSDNIAQFHRELGWREFSYSLLYAFPELPQKNLQSKFDHFPWQQNESILQAWKLGQTGHPLVDAGMRELWQTGFMHNRVRMVVASFLVKNLLLHWHFGERWFWDCLVDADLAANSTNWQWVAGCGADAAPYFRIFNPRTQGQKFDPTGKYTKQFVPELEALPDKYLFCPWEAPKDILNNAGVSLGENYPKPIVDLRSSRLSALEAYKEIK